MKESPSLVVGPLQLWVTGRVSLDSGRRWPSDIIAASFSLTTGDTEIVVRNVELAHVSELKIFIQRYNETQDRQASDFRLEFKPPLGCLWWYISKNPRQNIYPYSRMTIYYSEFQRDALGLPQGERHRYWINLTDDETAKLIQSCREIFKMYPERYG